MLYNRLGKLLKNYILESKVFNMKIVYCVKDEMLWNVKMDRTCILNVIYNNLITYTNWHINMTCNTIETWNILIY